MEKNKLIKNFNKNKLEKGVLKMFPLIGKNFEAPDLRLEKVTTTIHIRNRVFSHDFTAAILVSQNNKTAAMLVSQSHANAFICIDAGHVGENVLYESIVIRHFHIFHNAP